MAWLVTLVKRTSVRTYNLGFQNRTDTFYTKSTVFQCIKGLSAFENEHPIEKHYKLKLVLKYIHYAGYPVHITNRNARITKTLGYLVKFLGLWHLIFIRIASTLRLVCFFKSLPGSNKI